MEGAEFAEGRGTLYRPYVANPVLPQVRQVYAVTDAVVLQARAAQLPFSKALCYVRQIHPLYILPCSASNTFRAQL